MQPVLLDLLRWTLDLHHCNKVFVNYCLWQSDDTPMLSKSCEYAIRAVIFLHHRSQQEGFKISIDEIADGIKTPRHFTAKVLQTLSRKNIISSIKGPHGGFYMTPQQGNTTLLEIVHAIDGNQLLEGCLWGLAQCNENHPCPIHEQYKPVRKRLLQILTKSTVADLSHKLGEEIAFLTV